MPGIVARNEAERDRDRILYSSAFRRLDGVTQVAGAGELALLHNRLTHSLKVAQVARKIGATLLYIANDPDNKKIRDACYKFGGASISDRRDESVMPIEPWVLEAAGMLHDLGHPPFGHTAEMELQRTLSDVPSEVKPARPKGDQNISLDPAVPTGYHLPDGFEGNAQSFRIATRLAFGRYEESNTDIGLNLTRAVLAGMSKYPWLHSSRPAGVDVAKNKWGAYDSEKDVLEWALGRNVTQNMKRNVSSSSSVQEYRTIEAQAMDWADDITYAVHDLEDFSRAGLIPIEELTSGGERAVRSAFWQYCKPRILKNELIADAVARSHVDLDDAFQLTRSFLQQIGDAAATGRRSRENLRMWAAGAIDDWTGPRTLSIDPVHGILRIGIDALIRVEILKTLTWYFVIERPALGSAQQGQRRLIRELFVWLVTWSVSAYQGPPQRPGIRDTYSEGSLPARLVDYLDIAFRTDPNHGGYADERKSIARAVVDYIVGLTEAQAIELHARLGGTSVQSMLDGWFAV